MSGFPFKLALQGTTRLCAGTKAEQLQDTLHEFVEEVSEAGGILDAVSAEETSRVENLWRIREGISESLTKHGPFWILRH